jgi:hypothetical protein
VFEHESDVVTVVFGLEGDSVFVSSALQDLGHGSKVDAERGVAVSAVAVQTFAAEAQGDESDVTRVHGLEGDATGGAVKVGFVNEVFDTVHDLLEDTTLEETSFEHTCKRISIK